MGDIELNSLRDALYSQYQHQILSINTFVRTTLIKDMSFSSPQLTNSKISYSLNCLVPFNVTHLESQLDSLSGPRYGHS